MLDAVQFGAQQNGVATGRWPDGANDFYRLSAKTPGAPNAAILPSDVVINELMYNPISGNDDDQYVELYNRRHQRGESVRLAAYRWREFHFSARIVLSQRTVSWSWRAT